MVLRRVAALCLLTGWLVGGVLAASAQARPFERVDWKVEKYLGKSSKSQMQGQYGFSDNHILAGNVERIGKAVAGVSQRTDTVEEFFLVDTDEVNAFAAPGGYVFVTRGLIQRLSNEDELAGVLGHEWGHVAAKHGFKQVKKWPVAMALGIVAGKKFGVKGSRITDVALTMASLHYSRENEYQADELGVDYAFASAYDPRRFADFFMKLEADAPMGNLHRVDVAFANHPRTLNRYAAVQRAVAARQDDGEAWRDIARSLHERGQATEAFALLKDRPEAFEADPPLAVALGAAVGADPTGRVNPPAEAVTDLLPIALLDENTDGQLARAMEHTRVPPLRDMGGDQGVTFGAVSGFMSQLTDRLGFFEEWFDSAVVPSPDMQALVGGLAAVQTQTMDTLTSVETMAGAYERAGRAMALARYHLAHAKKAGPATEQLARAVVGFTEAVPEPASRRVAMARGAVGRLVTGLQDKAMLAEGQVYGTAAMTGSQTQFALQDLEFQFEQAAQEQAEAHATTLAVRRETETILAQLLDFQVSQMGAVERRQLPRLLAHRLMVDEGLVREMLAADGWTLSDLPYAVEAANRGILTLSTGALPARDSVEAAKALLTDMDLVMGWLAQDVDALSREALGVTPQWLTFERGDHTQKARKALSELMVGDPGQAHETYRALLQDNSVTVTAPLLVQAAQAAALAADFTGARELLAKALEQDPSSTKALNLLGLYATDGETRVSRWRQSLKVDPDQPVIASRLAAAYAPGSGEDTPH